MSQHRAATEPGLWWGGPRMPRCLCQRADLSGMVLGCDPAAPGSSVDRAGMLQGATRVPVRAEMSLWGLQGWAELGRPGAHHTRCCKWGDGGDAGSTIAPTQDFLPRNSAGRVARVDGAKSHGGQRGRGRDPLWKEGVPVHAPMPGVRGGRGGCEAEAHPVSGKLSHLFPRPVWATPQPGAVSQCPQKARWHFWDVSRGFSGHLLFNIWVATWELESCWVCWVWGFLKGTKI